MPTPDILQASLQFLNGVGPRRATELGSSGLHTLEDLLLRFPIRYEDRARFQPIGGVQPGETVSVEGEVLSGGVRSTRRRGFSVFEILLGDPSGQIRVTFFNQPFLKDVFGIHQRAIVFGKVERRPPGGLQFTNPQYELVGEDSDEGDLIHTGRIVPVYERVGKVTPKMLRRIVHTALQRLPDDLDDPLPGPVRQEHDLPDRRSALVAVHFPQSRDSLDELNRFRTSSQRRLIFEEFFLFQVGLALRRAETDTRLKPRRITVDDRIRKAALDVLPFRLTGDQKQALKEIVADLQRAQPMNRLLQGDVGSGKTIVALLAALVAMENGLQVAVMSPTELLAEQHFFNLSHILRPSRFEPVRLTGAMSAKERRAVWDALASGDTQLVVGTHTLVQDAVRFEALGLVIIDEQHRFGVVQRATLREKGLDPDVLVMTATPIPRTLALTAYGDLDVSVIRELPPGRQPITTRVRSDTQRDAVYRFVDAQLEQGRQGYVVYPLVEASSKLELKAATEMAEHLSTDVFGHRTVALLHGRMKPADRDRVMQSFTDHSTDLLVATTVVEVGIDVPNASIMLVENAERFGLAQLHQLRGRVGRGEHASHCILLYHAPLSDLARARLDTLAETIDGFELAERDLELRGPGDFFGTRQHGMPTLRVGDLLRDQAIMEDARRAATDWLTTSSLSATALENLRRKWSERFGLVGVG
jgi:ATP-dependent DNA helicase RecG